MASPMSRVNSLVSADIGNYLTNKETWGGILYNVKSYGAKGDGLTDDSVTIQAAFTAAAAANVPAFLPSGTYIVTQLSIPSGLKISGNGPMLSIIKRKANSTNTQFSILQALSGSDIVMDGIGVDGNKTNVTTASHNVIISACKNVKISNCRFYNSKSSGFWMGNSTNEIGKDESSIIGCKFDNNTEDGTYLSNEKELLVTDSKFLSNGMSGLSANDTLNKSIIFTDNESAYNGNHGVLFSGHVNNDPLQANCQDVTVNGNQIHDNSWWGLTYQGSGGVIVGNKINSNGTTGNGHAGLLLNGYDLTVTGNEIKNNNFFGVDIGDAVNGTIGDNIIANNGNATDGGYGINIESAESWTVTGNYLSNNGNATAGAQIYVHGIGAGGSPFLNLTVGIQISSNFVKVGNANQTGILVDTYCDYINTYGNTIMGASSSSQAIRQEAFISSKAENNNGTNLTNPVLTSASTVAIPDSGEFFFVNGTTTISTINTDSSNRYYQKVSRINVTAGGSGYTSAPTISFSGGGGSGATATANIYNGQVVSILITNNGSGYTSAPTISFSGGGGSGATATTVVGCNNFSGRQITIKFQDSITLNNTGNLVLVGTTFSATNNSQLVLVGSYGNWYEVSRATI